MTIEQRLVRDLGVTDFPDFGVWLLADGTMVNGSYGGHQRDVDHHEIGQYFKRSKFEDVGSSAIYIKKFMRRGNIRMSCSEFGCCFELWGPPTKQQFRVMSRVFGTARRNCVDIAIDRHSRRYPRARHETYAQFMAYLERYTDLVPDRG